MHYKIAIGKDNEKLQVDVNELIGQGYEPVGGIAVEAVQVGTTLKLNLYQGMISKHRDSSGKKSLWHTLRGEEKRKYQLSSNR